MTPSRTRTIVIAGVLSAIAILLGVTRVGYIPWGATSLTIMHVPVIIGAVLEGPLVGALIGLIFGVTSLIQASIPNGFVDVAFLNPLVSVLPRLLIGPAAWLVWTALKRWPVAGLLLAGAAGSLTNTIFVLGMLGVLNIYPWEVILPVVVANGLPELVLSAVIVLAVVAAWRQIDTGRKGADL